MCLADPGKPGATLEKLAEAASATHVDTHRATAAAFDGQHCPWHGTFVNMAENQ
jgi:hypothetical protein